MGAMGRNPLKQAIAEAAFQGFREGVTIQGAESYDILKPDRPTDATMVLSVKTEGRHNRYFTIKVVENV